MKNGDDIAAGRTFEILIALHRGVIEKAVRRVREKTSGLYFGVHGLGEDIVKGQTKNVRAEVIDARDSAEVVTKRAFARQTHLFTALIHRRAAGAAIEHTEIIEIDKRGVARLSPEFSLRGPSPGGEIVRPKVSIHASIDGPEQRFAQDGSLYRGGPDIGNEKSRLPR